MSILGEVFLKRGANLESRAAHTHPKHTQVPPRALGAPDVSAAAPKLWNGLPVELRQATSLNSFKSRLKTYLFKK